MARRDGKPRWPVWVLLLAAVAGWCLWYTRPLTLEQLCPDLPMDQVTGVSGWYRLPDSELQDFTLDETQTEALLTLVKGQTFRRSLTNLLPRAGIRFASGGDFSWTVNFEFRGEPLRDAEGNGSTGVLLQLEDFFGELSVSDNFAQKDWEVHSPGFSQWRRDVFSILTEGGE